MCTASSKREFQKSLIYICLVQDILFIDILHCGLIQLSPLLCLRGSCIFMLINNITGFDIFGN